MPGTHVPIRTRSEWADEAGAVKTLDQNGSGPNLLLTHETQPEERYLEEDQTDPAGRWRRILNADILSYQRAATSGWATFTTLFQIDTAGPLLPDDVVLGIGSGRDGTMVNRSTSLDANTALTGVLVGTPVTAATPANSLLVSNITANGDIAFFLNDGSGNSWEYLRFDGSAKAIRLNMAESAIDFLLAGESNAGLVRTQASSDSLSIGGVPSTFVFCVLNGSTVSRTFAQSNAVELQAITGTFTDTGGARTLTQLPRWWISIPTYANASSAVTVTRASTFYIVGPPAAGTNFTLTNTFALWVDAGLSVFDGDVVIGALEGDTAAPSNGLLRAPDIKTGGAGNVAGADLTIRPGLGTGTGDEGTIIFSLPIVAAAGDNIQTTATRLALDMAGSTTVLTMAFAQAAIISTAATTLTLAPTTLLLLTGGLTFQSSSSTEIGICVTNGSLTVGSLGSIVLPVKTDTGAPVDASMGNLDGAFGYNSFDNTLEVRDGVNTYLSVGVAGYVVQRSVPALELGMYHHDQFIGERKVDETRCFVCGHEMQPLEQVTMWANGRVRNDDLHAVFGHLHPEKDQYIARLEHRIAELERLAGVPS